MTRASRSACITRVPRASTQSLFRLLISILLAATAGLIWAQDYPSKPIRVVVPFPPGGASDIIAREVSLRVAQANHWTFVIDNRPGAGGSLGVDAVAKSPADGLTLLLGQTSNLAINPSLYARLPYDPIKDLTPIALLADAPMIIVTAAASKFQTVDDVLAEARQKPGTVSFASSGNGSVGHLTAQQLQGVAKVKLQHIPYKGASQALTDVISGNVDLYFTSIPSVLQQVLNGRLRALAVTSSSRLADLPQVATVSEAGFRGFEAVSWFGLLAPANTPGAIVQKLNAAINAVLQQPELRKRLRDEGAVATGGSSGQFARQIRDDMVHWGSVVRESGARID